MGSQGPDLGSTRVTRSYQALRWLRVHVQWVDYFGIPAMILTVDFLLRFSLRVGQADVRIPLVDASTDMALLAVASFSGFIVNDLDSDRIRACAHRRTESAIRVFLLLFLVVLWLVCLRVTADVFFIALGTGTASFILGSAFQEVLLDQHS